jgi:hypothetical protein
MSATNLPNQQVIAIGIPEEPTTMNSIRGEFGLEARMPVLVSLNHFLSFRVL